MKMTSGQSDELGESLQEEDITHYYGKPLRDPILGKYFQLPGPSATEQAIDLDISTSYTPVYTHLKVHEANDLERPSTPPVIRRTQNANFMKYYEPQHQRSEPAQKTPIPEDTAKLVQRASGMQSLFFEKPKTNKSKKDSRHMSVSNSVANGATDNVRTTSDVGSRRPSFDNK